MQTKRNTKSKVTDIFFIAFCIVGALYSINQFREELFHSLEKINEQPIATVTFKYRTAQRCFIDRVIWDRLRENSPLYNGDSIRTSDAAQAIINFIDGSELSLDENTFVQIFHERTGDAGGTAGGGVSVSFHTGNINAQSSSSRMTITSGENSFLLSGDSGASLKKAAEESTEMQVQVEKGSAVLSAAEETFDIEEGHGLAIDTEGIKEIPLVVTFPERNAKYITERAENISMNFAYNSSSGGEIPFLLLAVSETSYFSEPQYTLFKGGDDISLSLTSGSWWWRMYVCENERNIPAGRVTPARAAELADLASLANADGSFSLVYAEIPKLVVPAANSEYSYKTKKPSIRFMWEGNEIASSYLFEIADNPRMENPVVSQRGMQTSSIVSELGAGTYYFRVTPFYAVSGYGTGTPSEIRSIVIKEKRDLPVPALQYPFTDELINIGATENSAPQDIYFSWKSIPEDVEYTFSLWQEGRETETKIIQTTKENYVSIPPVAHGIESGRWLWNVNVFDKDGNEQRSATQSFYAVQSELEQRTLFPPDNYHLAVTRTQDIKYTWKTNISEISHLQISTKPDFSDIIIDVGVENTSLQGRHLEVGTYYWRIFSTLGALEFKTEPKMLVIEPPLARPPAEFPKSDERVIVQPDEINTFRWGAVEGADYYQFKILTLTGEPVYEENFIDETSISLDLSEIPQGNYRWSIQAHREEKENVSKSVGYIGNYNFFIRKLTPVTLALPVNNTVFEGVNAVKSPAFVEWNSIEKMSYVMFRLWKKSPEETDFSLMTEIPLNDSTRRFPLPPLYEGEYEWAIVAMTDDGYEVSSRVNNNFSVGKLARLPAAQNTLPADNLLIDRNYLINSRKIDFIWNRVQGADQYVLSLEKVESDGSRTNILEETFDSDSTQYEMEDLAVLGEGTFAWSIEAQSLFEGVLFQNGEINEKTFRIELPQMRRPTVREEDNRVAL